MTPRLQCSTFRDLVDDLVGKDLRPERTAEAVAHARACLPCARLWKAAADRSAAFSALRPEALEAAGVRPPEPGETTKAVFARLAVGEGAERWTARWSRRVAAAAVLIASAMAGYQWTRIEDSRASDLASGPIEVASPGVAPATSVSNPANPGRELRPYQPAPTYFTRQLADMPPVVGPTFGRDDASRILRNSNRGFIAASTSLRTF